jgi:hypothetical protein
MCIAWYCGQRGVFWRAFGPFLCARSGLPSLARRNTALAVLLNWAVVECYWNGAFLRIWRTRQLTANRWLENAINAITAIICAAPGSIGARIPLRVIPITVIRLMIRK